MDGFTFQTHSVYRDKVSGVLLLLVHHNSMALCSMLLNEKDDSLEDAPFVRTLMEHIPER